MPFKEVTCDSTDVTSVWPGLDLGRYLSDTACPGLAPAPLYLLRFWEGSSVTMDVLLTQLVWAFEMWSVPYQGWCEQLLPHSKQWSLAHE